VIGEEELAKKTFSVRDMKTGEQRETSISDGPGRLLRALREPG
jgi:histidyl-tRNA synthetase